MKTILSRELAQKVYMLLKIKGRDMYHQTIDYATGKVLTTFIYIDEENMNKHIEKMTKKEGFYCDSDQSHRMYLYCDLNPKNDILVFYAIFRSQTINMFED